MCLPSSREEVCAQCFRDSKSLPMVTFESRSGLWWIGGLAFCIPSSPIHRRIQINSDACVKDLGVADNSQDQENCSEYRSSFSPRQARLPGPLYQQADFSDSHFYKIRQFFILVCPAGPPKISLSPMSASSLSEDHCFFPWLITNGRD
jgi:hypothetical protein